MSGRPAPPKPWERNRSADAQQPSTNTPPSPGDSLPKPWERASQPGSTSTTMTVVPNSNSGALAQQPAARPWEARNNYGSSYGGVGSPSYARPGYGGGYGSGYYGGGGYTGSGYGTGYGTGGYGTGGYGTGGYGMYGGYGGYGGGYGGSMYGGSYGRPFAGGYYNGGIGSMGPWEPRDPNAPAPPSAWQAMLTTISGIVHFFGRLSFLVDENAHAVHFFIGALLQLLDRFGSLYGELARFVLRLLGFKQPKNSKAACEAAGLQSPAGHSMPPSGGGPWDSVWGSQKKTS